MKRREVLAAACVGLAGLSGCPDDAPDLPRTGGEPSGSPGPPPLSTYGCPPYGADGGNVVCSHTVAVDAASVYLLPSERTAQWPDEPLELTLFNGSSAELEFNPYSWTIRVEGESEWAQLDREVVGDGRLTVAPGTHHRWTLREAVDAITRDASLEPGTYTAEITVPDPDGPAGLTCLALFRLE